MGKRHKRNAKASTALAVRGRPRKPTGELAPRPSSTEIIYDRMPINFAEPTADEVLTTAYEKSVYFSVCLDAITEAVSSVPMVVNIKNTKSNTWEPAPNHPLQEFLDYPNPFLTTRSLLERLAGFTLISGNGLFTKVRINDGGGINGKGTPVELWPLDPDNTRVFAHPVKYIDRYEYGVGPNKQVYDPLDVIHISRTNYRNMRWGQGSYTVGKRLIDFDTTSLDWNHSVLRNQGVFRGVFSVKSRLSQKQQDDLRLKIKERQLYGAQAGEDLIIGADTSYTRIGANPQDMDWLQTRKLTRQDIAMLMRVPLPMISIYDDATLANISQARKIFWQDRIIPFLHVIEDAFNLSVVPEFGDRKELWVTFDLSNVEAVRENKFEQARVANVLVRNGWKPRAVNTQLNMGYKDEDIVEGFLVTEVSAIGTAAGTREHNSSKALKTTQLLTPSEQNKGQLTKEQPTIFNVVKWTTYFELAFEVEKNSVITQLQKDHTRLPLLAETIMDWRRLDIRFTKEFGKGFDIVKELKKSVTMIDAALKKCQANGYGKGETIAIVTFLYNHWKMSRSKEIASQLLSVALNDTLDNTDNAELELVNG